MAPAEGFRLFHAGDERLLPVQHIRRSVRARGGPHGREVAPSPRLGRSDAEERLAGADFREDLALGPLGAVPSENMAPTGLEQEEYGRGHGEIATADLLRRDFRQDRGGSHPAVLAGNGHRKQTEVGHRREDLGRDPAFRIDLRFVRAEDAVAEASDGGLEGLLLVTQSEIHGRGARTAVRG